MTMRCRELFLLLPLLLASGGARAETERILSYQSDITVHENGSMTVRETIAVRAEGAEIKRGIYRDFPTLYRGSWLTRMRVPFEVVEVLRDGKPEAYHTETLSNGKRVRIGRADVFLSPGVYTYTLTYKTDRQLGFFTNHDELYWNVTGNDWAFEIEKATAKVILPKGVPRDRLKLEGYTGPRGARGKNFTSALDGEGNAVFTTTRSLPPKEGLTIVVGWPKGYIQEPSLAKRTGYFFSDNLGLLVGLVGILVVFAYYMRTWIRVGRDPARGTIIPLFDPPKRFSPAAVRYLVKMGYDDRCLTATILNMAVKGFLTIKEEDGVYVLVRTDADASSLLPEEKKVAAALLEDEGDRSGQPSLRRRTSARPKWQSRITLKSDNHSAIRAAIESLKGTLKLNLEKHYFLTNQRYLIPGLILSGVVLLAAALFSPGSAGDMQGFERIAGLLFMCVWLTGWSVGVAFLMAITFSQWRAVFAGGGQALFAMGGAVFLTLFAIPFLAGEAMGLWFLISLTSVWMVPILAALAALAIVFHHLLKAPTHAGRKTLDEIEGLRMYLTTVEQPHVGRSNAPAKTPELFEKLLPYALALGIEDKWAEQFSDVLTRAIMADATGAPYSPSWYHGPDWSTLGAAGFASAVGSSLSSAISSSSTAPGSSSGFSSDSGGGGGGGGSSGGGGGGGGGGGW